MKKMILTTSLILLSAVFAYSQTGSGNLYLGGSFNLGFGSTKYKTGSNSNDGPKTFNFGINPNCGYFVAENFMIGLGLGYDMNSTKTKGIGNNEDKVTVSAFNVGPFARYYMMPVKNMGAFMQGNIAVGFGKTKTEETVGGTTTSDEIKMTAFVVGVTPGLVFFVGEKVAFEASIGGLSFVTSTDKQTDGDTEHKTVQNDFSLDFGRNFTFGVAVHL